MILLRLGRLARSPRDSLVSFESRCGALDDSRVRVVQAFLQCFNRFGRDCGCNAQQLTGLVPGAGLGTPKLLNSLLDLRHASRLMRREPPNGLRLSRVADLHYNYQFIRNPSIPKITRFLAASCNVGYNPLLGPVRFFLLFLSHLLILRFF
jgi:hypothetical protein